MVKRENFIPDNGNISLDPNFVPGPDNVISDRSGRGASRPDTVVSHLEDLHPDQPNIPFVNNGGRGGGSGDSDSRGDRGGEPTITPDIFNPDPDLDPDVNLENLYS